MPKQPAFAFVTLSATERPEPAIAATCPGYNQWKCGMNGLPPYTSGQPSTALEQQYAARDVIYLLGTRDTNPNHPALDKTCMAEAQGPSRYARGHAYYAALRHLRLRPLRAVRQTRLRRLNSQCEFMISGNGA